MATNSAATRRANRDGHGYHTGVAKVNGNARCDTCKFSLPPAIGFGNTSRDLLCERHATGVKTHGVCTLHQPKASP